MGGLFLVCSSSLILHGWCRIYLLYNLILTAWKCTKERKKKKSRNPRQIRTSSYEIYNNKIYHSSLNKIIINHGREWGWGDPKRYFDRIPKRGKRQRFNFAWWKLSKPHIFLRKFCKISLLSNKPSFLIYVSVFTVFLSWFTVQMKNGAPRLVTLIRGKWWPSFPNHGKTSFLSSLLDN